MTAVSSDSGSYGMKVEVKITSLFIIILWRKGEICGVTSERFQPSPQPNENDEHSDRTTSMSKRGLNETVRSNIVTEWCGQDDRQTMHCSLSIRWSNDLDRTGTNSKDEDQRTGVTSDVRKRVVRWSIQIDEVEDRQFAHRRDPLGHRDNRSGRRDPVRVLLVDTPPAIGSESWSTLVSDSKTRAVEQHDGERAGDWLDASENTVERAAKLLDLNVNYRKQNTKTSINCLEPLPNTKVSGDDTDDHDQTLVVLE